MKQTHRFILLVVCINFILMLYGCEKAPVLGGESSPYEMIEPYKISFVCDDSISVTVYNTQDYNEAGAKQNTAYSRDGDTGYYRNDGTGEVNFKVSIDKDYYAYSIDIQSASGYKSVEGKSITGADDIWRITDITENLEVVITEKPQALELPVMEIFTENGADIVDKENYIQSKITVSNSDYELTDAPAKIRGRGNTSWTVSSKKPYRIKFDEKTDLFGNGEAKDWTLIANFVDKSLLRNYTAYALGGVMENLSGTTTTTQFVDLYLNGSYRGVYQICEQIETGTNRVDIEDNINEFSADNIGYLLEMDARAPSEGVLDTDYISINKTPYAIKSPDYGDITADASKWNSYVTFIKSYMQQSVDALSSGNYTLVQQYIDVDSFAESYIVHS